MYWWDLNVLHYYVIERHLGPWGRSLRRQYTALTGRWRAWHEAWSRARAPLPKETRMSDAVETPPLSPAVLGRALLARLDPEATAAIIAAVSEEVRKEVHEAAVAEARAQLAQEFSDLKERLLDDLEAQRRQLEKDAAAEADHAAAQQLALDEQDFTDRLDSVRTRVRAWRARAETAEALCTSLLTQLCGGEGHPAVYLYSGGEGLRELDLHAAQTVLARVGLQLKSEQRASARTVATVVEPGKTVAHSRFKVVKTLAPGVVDEDADAEDAAAI